MRGTEALVLVRGVDQAERPSWPRSASWIAAAIAGLALLALAMPGPARADGVLLMPAEGDPGLGAAAITAHAAVARALEAQGVELLSYAAARERAGGGELAACRELTCAAALCKKAKAELVVMVAVRERASDARASDTKVRPRDVHVTLVEPGDARFFGRAEVAQGDYGAAAREALLDARAFQLLGPGPHVRVESEPEGADVSIDGELAGETPYRAAIEPGKHVVEVRLDGYRTQAQMIDIPRGAQQPARLRIQLEARAQAPGTGAAAISADIDAATTAPPKKRSRPIVGPLILGAVGLGLITYDVVMIASAGCAREERGACTQTSEIDPAPAIVIGAVGAAALGAGLVWFLLGGEDDDEPGVSARVSPLGGELRARF